MVDNTTWGFGLPSLENGADNLENASNSVKNDKTPEKTYNPETGLFEYADRIMQKLHDVRKKLHNRNIDPLAAKQEEMSRGLEEIGLSRKDMGKTGDSSTGEITEKHKKIANSQTEDAKAVMIKQKIQAQGR